MEINIVFFPKLKNTKMCGRIMLMVEQFQGTKLIPASLPPNAREEDATIMQEMVRRAEEKYGTADKQCSAVWSRIARLRPQGKV